MNRLSLARLVSAAFSPRRSSPVVRLLARLKPSTWEARGMRLAGMERRVRRGNENRVLQREHQPTVSCPGASAPVPIAAGCCAIPRARRDIEEWAGVLEGLPAGLSRRRASWLQGCESSVPTSTSVRGGNGAASAGTARSARRAS